MSAVTQSHRRRGLTDGLHSVPFYRLALELERSNTVPLFPVFQEPILHLGGSPVGLARIGIFGSTEPSSLVRREFTLLACSSSCALVLLQLGLEVVGVLELAFFESVLVGSKATIGGREPHLEIGIVVIERDRKGSSGGNRRSADTQFSAQ